ncbi:MAG: cytochrome c biogenesis protein CcdA [Phycisphaerales bacterium]
MDGTRIALIFVVCAALWPPVVLAQDDAVAGATEIVQFELEQSSARLKPARWEGRPGIEVIFEGTEDIHYYARPETAPAPGLELTLTATSDGLEFDKAVLPAWEIFDDPTGQKIEVYVGNFSAFIPIRGELGSGPEKEVPATVKVAGIACTSRLCLPPFEKTLTTNLNLADRANWPASSVAALSPPPEAPVLADSTPPAEDRSERQAVLSYSRGVYYLLAIVAGLSINIMPCVLPVLPLILLRLIDHSRQTDGRRIAPGMAFCAGIILFFVAFALVSAIVTLTTGAVLDLNSLFRYPAAVIVLFLAIVFFGLVMLDVVTLSLPSSVAGRQGSSSGLAGSVGMGFFAGVLSTPCSGALLGFVLVWAQTQPLLVSSTAITLMGVGMALPYAVIILIPSLLDRIPKPGYWMDIFKKSAGFLLFLIAVKLTLAALPKERLLNVLMYGVVFSFCVWMWGKWVDFSTPLARRWIIRLVAVALAVGAGAWLLPSHAQTAGTVLDWKPYDAEAVQRAVSQRRPVLLKFTADWCTNCKVLEKRVYEDPAIVELMQAKSVLPIKADTTVIDYPATRDLNAVYGEAGNVPVSIILLPDGSREKLRGIFDKEELIRILSRFPGSDK